MVLPPDFTTFWKQALQQGFKPKAASVGKAILFPSSVEALGKDGHNLSSEVWWTPNHPYKSSINGMTAKQLADAYGLLSAPAERVRLDGAPIGGLPAAQIVRRGISLVGGGGYSPRSALRTTS